MEIKQLTVNAIRVLSAEAIEKAKSGHPGMPLGAAPIGYAAFTNMTFNPKDTAFDNRGQIRSFRRPRVHARLLALLSFRVRS